METLVSLEYKDYKINFIGFCFNEALNMIIFLCDHNISVLISVQGTII